MSVTVNGTVLQKHQVRGPVGYTLIGTPTITNGVVTSANNSNCLLLTDSFQLSGNEVEIVVKNTGNPSFFRTLIPSSSTYFSFSMASNGYVLLQNGMGGAGWGPLKTTEEYVRFYKSADDSITTLSVGTSPSTWTNTWTTSNFVYPAGNSTMYISNYVASGDTVDLNETYIKVNGKLWFYQPQNTRYIVKDGKLVWADPNLYLQSDGNQYIDTDYVPVENDALSSSVLYPTTPSTNMALFSAGTGSYQLVMVCNYAYAYIRYFNNSSAEITKSQTENTWYDFSIENGTSTYAGVSGSTQYLAALDGNDTTLRLFKRKNDANPLIGSLKAFVITNNGEVKRHFVPVPQGLVIGSFTVPSNGMFDIITQQFYGNSGTGTFSIGRDE